MNRFVVLILALFCCLSQTSFAQGLDDEYVQVFKMIQEADTLSSTAPSQALAKYLDAQAALDRLHKGSPDWNTRIVNYRLTYLANRISALSATTSPAPTATTNANAAVAAPEVSAQAAQAQVSSLQEQLRQLQSDKGLLESKLKEALALRPAAVDPGQLTKAEDRIKVLQKENDLLKVDLQNQQHAAVAPSVDTKSLEATQRSLKDAQRQLADQGARLAKVTNEKDALESRLKSVSSDTAANSALVSENQRLKQQVSSLQTSLSAAPKPQDNSRQLADAQAQISKLQADKESLRLERDALESKLKNGSSNTSANSTLVTENQQLKQQVTSLQTSLSAAPKPQDNPRQLADAQAQIAKLQADNESLRLEKVALENRVKQINVTGAATNNSAPAVASDDSTRIKQLESQRDDLQKRLDALTKGGKKAKNSAQVADLESQLSTARARLEVLEAHAVPYTSEELQLLQSSQPALAASDPKAGKKSINELPAGSAALVAEAQRSFAAKDYDKAESAYLQVLKQDPKNVPTLGNLAAIEVESQHFDKAEANVKKALAQDPEDPYSLYVLGILRFRQGKYDEALDALSHSAKLDPQNAEVQNYLGLALSEKGQRAPAEAALRKAVQLQPGYAAAHYNLAVVYATQQPPATELARWHYQKALSAGHPRNSDLERRFEPRQ